MDEKIKLLERYFVSEFSHLGIANIEGKPCPLNRLVGRREAIKLHISGEKPRTGSVVDRFGRSYNEPVRICIYGPTPLGHSKFGAIDFDGGAGHKNPLKTPFRNAIRVQVNAKRLGISSFLERSASGEGAHLWFFFPENTEASFVRGLLFLLLENEKFELANGGVANPHLSIGVEVFPKSERLRADGFGSAIWLPFWHEATPQNNCEFYEVCDVAA